MSGVVFFADVLGFATLSKSDAGSAERALDDVALLFSDQDEITRLLQVGSPWTARYGLSDSIFLIADDDAAAAAAAAQFFFRLAFLNASVHERVLMRGALARGEVRKRGPIFPESAHGNVVGEAVVKAAMLEKSGAKGPRLLLDDSVASKLAGSAVEWLLDDTEGPKELLWTLPPDPSDRDISHLRPVVEAAVDAFLSAPEKEAEHYVAYIDLVLRALARLRTVDFHMAAALVGSFDAAAVARRLDHLVGPREPLERRTLRRLDALT
jgi:hypothetical protein